ncbi:hypothetical protein CLV56_1203 [Mumia flava]|uniref:Uncharacterized protein n=1 Tax=Mumia flava TaxID=1348852 RepID=A0A0B2BPA8_9ACTN|nr:hypothetical protein [Mumia flava]PJJ56984.1 hypothetical protein CLV56_1203 [Mumia flava]
MKFWGGFLVVEQMLDRRDAHTRHTQLAARRQEEEALLRTPRLGSPAGPAGGASSSRAEGAREAQPVRPGDAVREPARVPARRRLRPAVRARGCAV